MDRAHGLQGNCTGCGACYAVCPVNAIEISMNVSGFFSASVNEKCTNCGRCGIVCPVTQELTGYIDFQHSTQYGAYLRDSSLLRGCASGGAAYGFYKTAITDGFKAIGTYYDPGQNRAITGVAHTLEEAAKFRGSKYLQGFHADAIYTAMHTADRYIVCGTPCEVYGYRRAAQLLNCEDRFIFVDLFCHGVPSYLAWNQYLKETVGTNTVESVIFRDHEHGWRRNVLSIQTMYYRLSNERSKDLFYHVFDDSYIMSDGCYICRISQRYGCSDIRIGDLWDQELCADGVFRSCVCIGTERGRTFWEMAKQEFNCVKIKKQLPASNSIPERLYEIRKVALQKLKKGELLDSTIRSYRAKESLKKKLSRHKMIVNAYQNIKKAFVE
jgi:coenzyme F420-reducing hydrogenase beta subunit